MIVVTPMSPAIKFGAFGKRGPNDMCWKLFEDLHVIWEGFNFTVPKGFLLDMGSVPWLFQWIVQPTGPGNIAFIAHDYAYSDHPGPVDEDGVLMTREQADEMMKDLLEYAKVAPWRAFFAWRGVRRGGWLSWKKERKIVLGSKHRRNRDG